MLDSKDVLKIFTEHLALRDPITIDIDNIKTEFDAEKELAAFNVLHSITLLIFSMNMGMVLLLYANMIHQIQRLLN